MNAAQDTNHSLIVTVHIYPVNPEESSIVIVRNAFCNRFDALGIVTRGCVADYFLQICHKSEQLSLIKATSVDLLELI